MLVVKPFPAFLTLSEGRNEKGKEGRKEGGIHIHRLLLAVVGALSVGGIVWKNNLGWSFLASKIPPVIPYLNSWWIN